MKCDKNFPCANCARKHIDCIYLTTEKRKTRGPGKHRAGERLEQMTSRVAQLEQVLGKLQSRSTGEDQSPGQEHPRATSESASVSQHENQGGKLNQVDVFRSGEGVDESHSTSRLLVKGGKSQYIRNKFWASINEEVSYPVFRKHELICDSLEILKTCLATILMLLQVNVTTTNPTLQRLFRMIFFLGPLVAR